MKDPIKEQLVTWLQQTSIRELDNTKLPEGGQEVEVQANDALSIVIRVRTLPYTRYFEVRLKEIM